jgi:hypothetical protein
MTAFNTVGIEEVRFPSMLVDYYPESFELRTKSGMRPNMGDNLANPHE